MSAIPPLSEDKQTSGEPTKNDTSAGTGERLCFATAGQPKSGERARPHSGLT
jgi:hypothetical protein